MQAPGIGDGARLTPVVDTDDRGALFGEKPRNAQADDTATDHRDVEIAVAGPPRCRLRVHRPPALTMSAILIGFTGARGAKKASSSIGRPRRAASIAAATGAQ